MLTLQDFAEHLGAPFAVAQEGLSTPFFLGEARAPPGAGIPGTRAPFSLLFRNAASLPQASYRLIHPALGEMESLLLNLEKKY